MNSPVRALELHMCLELLRRQHPATLARQAALHTPERATEQVILVLRKLATPATLVGAALRPERARQQMRSELPMHQRSVAAVVAQHDALGAVVSSVGGELTCSHGELACWTGHCPHWAERGTMVGQLVREERWVPTIHGAVDRAPGALVLLVVQLEIYSEWPIPLLAATMAAEHASGWALVSVPVDVTMHQGLNPTLVLTRHESTRTGLQQVQRQLAARDLLVAGWAAGRAGSALTLMRRSLRLKKRSSAEATHHGGGRVGCWDEGAA